MVDVIPMCIPPIKLFIDDKIAEFIFSRSATLSYTGVEVVPAMGFEPISSSFTVM